MYKVVFTKRAEKELANYKGKPALQESLKKLVEVLTQNPFDPPYGKLNGELLGRYSRRINRQHRLVYKVEEKIVTIMSIWSHYE